MSVRERQNNRRRYRDLASIGVAGILAPPPPAENAEIEVPRESYLRVVDSEVAARDAVSVAHKATTDAEVSAAEYKQRWRETRDAMEHLRQGHARVFAAKDFEIAELKLALKSKDAEMRLVALSKATDIKFVSGMGFTARRHDDGTVEIS